MTAGEAVAAKADADLVSSLASGAEAEFWINLDTQANLSSLDALSKEAKGTAVFEAKTQHAKATQANLIELLEEQGVDYQSYWMVNTIHVTGDADLLADVALLTEVESLTPLREITFEEPVQSIEATLDEEVAWGVENINSPQAWADFGALGEDIVVANIDTGVEFDHPALVNSYRGNNGDGTFSHDYNWFDPDGLCSTDAPCDDHDHGTHTMGTMVGKEDAQTVGVAPGAKWIAAKGCSASAGCPDTALLGSAQWILAPTDMAGNNPDPSKAPDVVNNSWGSDSDDPWFEEIVQSWSDAGIFSSWSNGNNGEAGCESSGSPGIYEHSYSSGAYDVNDEIAYFSSRGPGRDGAVKPNIAAPGVAVISADAGGAYRSMSGTSMAAPHTAGVVAQIWSAAPSLRGDIAGTWEILNTTARDTASTECGGTTENNNVFGEGRLDAYAAVAASPTGETGSLEGSVVSGDTALSGVALTAATADRTRETTTNDEGAYRYGALVAGEYELTASKFGYISETVSVSVTAGETAVADFDLEAAPSGSVSGTVNDGSGHGWPLYSKITVDGTDRVTHSDPITGEYSLDLPDGTYTLTVDPVIDGYDNYSVEVATGTESNVSVPVADACVAPGYEFDWDALTLREDFEDGTTPSGWTVDSRTEASWVFDDPDGRGNKTGSEGGFAIADDDYLGSGVPLDSDLISPVFDLTAANTPALTFASDYYHLTGSSATVSITTDGGATWTELWKKTASDRGKTVSLDLASYASATEAQVKFTYLDGNAYAWYWQVDDVQVGTPECVTVDGGLVMGHVLDANTGGPLNGAVVTDTVTGATGTSVETPDDANLSDGYYWMFTTETGAHDFTASRTGWQAETTSIDVVADGVATQGFTLGAGRIEVDTTSISTNVTMGGSWTEEVTLTNTGSAPVTVEVGERNGEFVPMGAPSATSAPMSAPATTDMVTSAEIETIAPNADGEWAPVANYPTAVFDATSASGDGATYVVGGIGSSATKAAYKFDWESGEWSAIADAPDAVMQARAAFVDGKLYVFGGWAGSTTLTKTSIYDPETNTWSQGAPMPATRAGMGIGVVDGTVYLVGGCDSSSCNATDTVFAYDVAGDSWSTLANYPTVVSHGACGASAGTLVCAGGSDGGEGLAATYAYNKGADSWEARADMPVGLWAMAFTSANDMLVVSNGVLPGNTSLTNATYGYDASSDSWTELAPSGTQLYRGTMACGIVKATGRTISNAASGAAERLEGFDGCDAGGADVTWLSTDTQTVTVNPGESVTIEVTMSGKEADGITQPGTYHGAIALNNDSPYGSSVVDVTMAVAPKANMGKAAIAVSAVACNGDTAALADAQVQLLAADGTRVDLTSDGTGNAAHWVKKGKYTVIVSKDGWAAAVQVVTVKAGKTTSAAFALSQLGCTATKTNGGWLIP
ncbi:S8 family serine peptidase [Stackebrandtia soli]|uniref:S8 family serine peptidase n=1 Tax=Stackebrandtia soli TaxID=1892856 RepID=UPI0039EA34E1